MEQQNEKVLYQFKLGGIDLCLSEIEERIFLTSPTVSNLPRTPLDLPKAKIMTFAQPQINADEALIDITATYSHKGYHWDDLDWDWVEDEEPTVVVERKRLTVRKESDKIDYKLENIL